MKKGNQFYCVGFFWYGNDTENQLPRFEKEGVWENGFDDKYIQKVKSVPVDSRIAAKTSYTRKKNGKTISVLKVCGIGTVTKNIGDGKTLKVDWDKDFKPFKLDGRGAYRSTISKVIHEENIDLIFGNKRKSENIALSFQEEDLQENYPTNQILYGPPGTGKTYNTINKAVAIIDGLKENSLGKYYTDREEIKDRFEELKHLGQIVFCTFHQTMAYEDFIEGIKPVMVEDELEENLGYHIEDGIFKRLCVNAKYDFYKNRFKSTSKDISRAEFFNLVYEEFISEIEEKIDKGEKVFIETKTGLKLFVTQITNQLNLRIKHDDAHREEPYTVSKNRLLKLFNHFNSLDDINSLHKDIRAVIGGANTTAYWAVLSKLYEIYDETSSKRPKEKEKIKKAQNYETIKTIVNSFPITQDKLNETSPEKYVIIIDEINRGNVSQIFGELITLIEDDKRLGKREALEVVLPYSKEKFGVPPNIYILGTMNTADRSVEALDAALRRRFSFEEKAADAKLIKTDTNSGIVGGIDLEILLNRINKRIEKLLDKDHQIGHSYFMSVTNVKELKLAFQNKIIPLLQEYFFGDYGKIGLVLGNGFFKQNEENEENIFATFNDVDASEFSDRIIYEIEDIRFMKEDVFIKAINLLLGN